MVNWAYIAGFFDGEGSICLNGNRGFLSYVVHLPQAEQRVKCLYDIKEFLESEGLHVSLNERKHKQQNENRSRMFNIRIARRNDVMKFIEGIMPFVIGKKLLSQDTWRFFRIYPELRRGKVMGKISQQIADRIKQECASGRKQCDIANDFGVHRATVSNIFNGKSWRGISWK